MTRPSRPASMDPLPVASESPSRSFPQNARAFLALLRRAGWAPALVFILHLVLVYWVDGYVYYPSLDIPMHFIGGVAMAYFLGCGFAALPEGAIVQHLRGAVEALFVVTATTTAAVFWEFAEFLVDDRLERNLQLDLEDTLLDLALGIAGSLAYLLLRWLLGRLGAVEPLLDQRGRIESA